ncbi:periplasmic protein [Planctomycetes bacterium Poly30]|uniref:Periplasmic protein n=1 Tax=Saltatorellus ferox TaxID=2528018 RepID=A0A518EVW9_9BACT|nr:periplasmic protein [Planctomycetes bacterium Poly30]
MPYRDRPIDPQDYQQERLRNARARRRLEDRSQVSGLDAREGRDHFEARGRADELAESFRWAEDPERTDYSNRQSFRNSWPSHYENTGNPDQDLYRGRYENDRDDYGAGRDSYSQRMRRAAQEFDLDLGLDDAIEVSHSRPSAPHGGKGPKNFRRSPERIQEDACERLEDHGHIDASEIEVEFQDGVLTLKGEVDSRKTKVRAEQCVESVRGVKDVMNHLSVNEGFFSKLKHMITGDDKE